MKNSNHHKNAYKQIIQLKNGVLKYLLLFLHFVQWSIHLLIPDEITDIPSLKKAWEIVKTHQRFYRLRYAFGTLVLLTAVLGSSAFYSLKTSPLLLAAATTFPFTVPANYTFSATAISLNAGIASLIAIDQIDDDNTATGFAGGTFSDTEFSLTNLQLDATGITNGTGMFTSRVIDAGSSVAWSTFNWTPQAPYHKELPDNAAIETNYTNRNVSMVNNELLLHLNESGGAVSFADTSGNAANGSCADCPTQTNGQFNNAFEFDGATNEIELPNSVLNGSGDSSIALWFRTANTGQQAIISGANGSNDNEYLLFLPNQTTIAFYTGESSGGNTTWAVPSMADNNWHHLVLTRDDLNNQVSAYFDGSLLSTQGTTINPVSIDLGGLFLGQEQDSVGGGFTPTQAFEGDMDEVAIFSRVLTASDVTAIYERTFHDIRFQLRSCDDSLCDTELFIGPDGTAGTFYDELGNATINLPSQTITNLSDNRYFQYQATLTSSDNIQTPQVSSISVGPTHFDASTPSITPLTGIPYTSLTGFTETLGGGNVGTVQYQISNDNVTYYYHNGANWVSAINSAQSNTALGVNAQISSFVSDIGTGDFYFRAFFFSTNGVQQVELDEVSISFENDPGNGGNGGGSFIFLALPPTPPAEGFKVLINEDNEFAESQNVTLSFNAGSDIKLVELSNEETMTESTTISYKEELAWDLCSIRGETQNSVCETGEKTVYARFSKGFGSTPSDVVSDTIILNQNVGTPVETPKETINESETNQTEEEDLNSETPTENTTKTTEEQQESTETSDETPSTEQVETEIPVETTEPTPPSAEENISQQPSPTLETKQETTEPLVAEQPETDQQLQVTPNGILLTSSIPPGPLGQSTIPTTLTEPYAGYYNGAFIIFTSGDVVGQMAQIEKFVDGQFFFTPPLSITPSVNDQFTITIPLQTEDTTMVSSNSSDLQGIATIFRDLVYPRDLIRTIFWAGVFIGAGVAIILTRILMILWQHHMLTHHATSIPKRKNKKT